MEDILKDAIINFQTNGETNQAAAIALYGILSFVPMFILTFLMVGHIFGSYPEVHRAFMEGIRRFSPSSSLGLLTQLGSIELKQHMLGWVGIISLIWFSSMIFSAIETAFNIIFRSRRPRNYFISKALAIAMIPAAWAVGITSILVTSIATILASQPLLSESGLPYVSLAQSTLFRYVIPYVVTVMFFTIVYKIIPTIKIPLSLALVGSAIFSALMELAKHLFTWYVANYTRYNIIYGSLETVVILIFWVFYIAMILLFCAELMSSYLRRDLILLERAFFKPDRIKLPTSDRLFRKFGRVYPKAPTSSERETTTTTCTTLFPDGSVLKKGPVISRNSSRTWRRVNISVKWPPSSMPPAPPLPRPSRIAVWPSSTATSSTICCGPARAFPSSCSGNFRTGSSTPTMFWKRPPNRGFA